MVSIAPRFSPEITAGHIMQAVVLVLTIGGTAATGYISIRGDIQDLKSSVGVQEAADGARLAELELRLTLDESSLKRVSEEDQAGRAAIRQKIDGVIDAIADLRTKIALKEDIRKR